MPITKRGVYHNLKESKYVVSDGDITFFFSSEYTLNKFMERYPKGREIFKQNINKMVDTKLNFDTLADIDTYEITEKRGFYVWLKGVSVNKDDLDSYVLRKMTEENSPVWKRTERKSPAERFK